MEQSPSSGANNHSANEEIVCLLCNPKVHYRVHKSPPLIPILSHMNPAHTFLSCFPIYSIIFPSTPMPSESCLLFRFSDQTFVYTPHLPHTPAIS